MKKYKLFILVFIVIITSFLTACGATGAATSWPGLSVDQERAYLAFNQFVYAIDLQSGKLIWRFPAEKALAGITFFAPPVITQEGSLIVGSYAQSGKNAILYNLDAATGAILGSFDEANNNYIASPLVTENGIYAPNANGYLYALDDNLEYRWRFPTSRAVWASPTTNEACDCIYVASMDHSIYAVDSDSGEQIWKTPDLGGAIAAPPTFNSDGTLFVGTSDNQMIALDTQDGSTIWAYNSQGWIWSGAALDDGNLYFGDLEGNLVALIADTGDELWTVKADGAILSMPLVFNDQVYYSTENTTIYSVDLDGKPAWQQQMSAKVYGPIVNSGNLLLVALTDNEAPLVAYDQDGKLVWSFTLAADE